MKNIVKKNNRLASVSEASAETCFSSMEAKNDKEKKNKNKALNFLGLNQVMGSLLKYSS